MPSVAIGFLGFSSVALVGRGSIWRDRHFPRYLPRSPVASSAGLDSADCVRYASGCLASRLVHIWITRCALCAQHASDCRGHDGLLPILQVSQRSPDGWMATSQSVCSPLRSRSLQLVGHLPYYSPSWPFRLYSTLWPWWSTRSVSIEPPQPRAQAAAVRWCGRGLWERSEAAGSAIDALLLVRAGVVSYTNCETLSSCTCTCVQVGVWVSWCTLSSLWIMRQWAWASAGGFLCSSTKHSIF